MNTLYKALLVLNYLAYIFVDICAWSCGVKYGLIFLLPLVIFPVTASIADKVVISRSDEFFLSEWSVFKKKVGWGNSVVFAIVVVLLLITGTNFRQRTSNGRDIEMEQEHLQTTNIVKDEAKDIELKKVIRNSGQQDDWESELKQDSFKQVYSNEAREEVKNSQAEEVKKDIQTPVVLNEKTETEIRKETKKQEAIERRKSRKEARQIKKRQRKEEK